MIDIESIRQQAQKAMAIGGNQTISWSDVLELIEEVDDLHQELEAAEEDVGHEQNYTEELKDEIVALEDEVEELKRLNRELLATANCKDCGTQLAEDICSDCYNTGGR